MSEAFLPRADFTQYQALKIQHVDICGLDTEMFNIGSPAIIPPVSLGRAELFALLANSAITNTGSSVVTGDLGLSPGSSVTGFPPGVVLGTQHITDAAAANAQTDAQAVYTALAAHGGYVAISATLDGQTLTPGYYSEASSTFHLASSGPGTLTLDGGGNPNALFVFKAASTLTTGAGGVPTITLINGASAANVFWLVGSSATINSGSAGTFQGTIIAVASITDTLGGTVNGRLIALGAAVTLSAATILTLASSAASGTVVIHIGEYVTKVYSAACKVDTSNAVVQFNQAQITIQDSAGAGKKSLFDQKTGTFISDQTDIVINGLAGIAANDCLSLNYVTLY